MRSTLAPEGELRPAGGEERKSPASPGPTSSRSRARARDAVGTASARIERMSGAAGAVLALAAALALLCATHGAQGQPLARRSAEDGTDEFVDYDSQVGRFAPFSRGRSFFRGS